MDSIGPADGELLERLAPARENGVDLLATAAGLALVGVPGSLAEEGLSEGQILFTRIVTAAGDIFGLVSELVRKLHDEVAGDVVAGCIG